MTKSHIANEIALYLTNDATCKCVLSGLTWNIDVMKDETKPSVRKTIIKTNNIYLTIYYGQEIPEELGLGYRIRRYTTSFFVKADSETNLQLAIEELETAFNCWEANGGGAFQTGGTAYHTKISFTTDMRGRQTAYCAITLQSKMEAKPT